MRLRCVEADEPGWPARWRGPYERSFGQPPWDEAPLAEQALLEQLRPARSTGTWTAVEALDGRTVLGGVCGWRAPVPGLELTDTQATLRALRGPAWWEHFLGREPFIAAELFVDPSARGRGVARALLDELCPTGLCWLATRADAPARSVYLHLGWELLGEAVCGTGERLAFFAREVTGPPLTGR